MRRIPISVCHILLLACALAGWSSACLAQSPDGDRARLRAIQTSDYCRFADDESMNELLKVIDQVDLTLPNIPPEENLYELRELAAVREMTKYGPTREGNNRMAVLSERRLYQAWAAHQSLSRARDAVERIRHAGEANETGPMIYKSIEARKLDAALQAVEPVVWFTRDLLAFWERESKDVKPLLTVQQLDRILGQTGITYNVQAYARCKLAKLPVE